MPKHTGAFVAIMVCILLPVALIITHKATQDSPTETRSIVVTSVESCSGAPPATPSFQVWALHTSQGTYEVICTGPNDGDESPTDLKLQQSLHRGDHAILTIQHRPFGDYVTYIEKVSQ